MLLENDVAMLIEYIGITRVSITTGLDRLGIPTAQAVCPGGRDVISTYSGKGVTDEQAVTGAIMEAFERQALLWNANLVTLCSKSHLEAAGCKYIPPESFREWSRATELSETIAWTKVDSLIDGKSYFAPAEIVFMGERPAAIDPVFAIVTSNGCASGSTIASAQRHAIYELIERHAISKLEITNVAASIAHQELARIIGLDTGQAPLPALGASRLAVDKNGVAKDFWDRLVDTGLGPTALIVSYDGAGYLVGVYAIDSFSHDVHWINAGFSFRPDAEEALLAAVVEIAQTRATLRQGSREDYGLREKSCQTSFPNEPWFSRLADEVSLSACKSYPELEMRDLCNVSASLFDCDLYMHSTHPVPGYCAVRILSPGAQNWHITGGLSSLRTHKPT